jgi:hypothetical protein
LFDNVVVTAIPELPVNALMGAGLLLVAGALKRRGRPRVAQ